MLVRKYQPGEERELWQLFFNTIRTVNVRDYSLEQVQAWAPDDYDEPRWRARIEGLNPYVCLHEGIIVGYGDLQHSGYIDHFYVHHAWQRQGVGTRLFETIEAAAHQRQINSLNSDVSITARPFFEARGFVALKTQEVMLGNVALTNLRMLKRLDD